jgi:upstream activation factor subunit UAF30
MEKEKTEKGEDGAPEPTAAQWTELEKRLVTILSSADLAEVTTKTLRKQLQTEFAVSLSSDLSKQWIKEQIEKFVDEKAEADQQPESEDEPKARKRAAPAKAAPARKRVKPSEDTDDDVMVEDPSHPPLSEEMASIVGMERANRFRLVKLLWIYIKTNGLQNPNDKRQILCDEKLKKAFGQTTVTAFSMSKFLSRHVLPQDGDGEQSAKESKAKGGASGAEKGAAKSKGSTIEYTGSAELAEFMGEGTNNRFAITKKLWAHIKENELQDPSKKKRVVCDDVLKKLFKVSEFDSFSLAKLVASHFPKKS